MRSLYVAIACVVVTGCTFGAKTCSETEPCGEGATCQQGFCVSTNDAGETGGGSGTGGGTATGGGTTTGGGSGTGGGSQTGGGGTPSVCEGVTCAEYEECLDVDGGASCQVTDIQIDWLTPDEQSRHNVTSVPAAIRVTHGGLATWPLASLPVAGAGTFSFDGGVWYGVLDLTGIPSDSPKDFVAGWPDAGVSSTRRIYFDSTPPEVVLTVLQRPPDAGDEDPDYPRYWKKDEAALIQVTVDGGRAPLATDIQTSWNGPVTSVACQCGSTCGCFAVDLKSAPLAAYAGTVPVGVGQIADEAGNLSNGVAQDISVTRFKWLRSLDLDTSGALIPVGVGREGAVVFGGTRSASMGPEAGTLAALRQSGEKLWQKTSSDYHDPYIPTGGGTGVLYGDVVVVAGPVVGQDSVWIATKSSYTALGEQHHFKKASLANGTANTSCSFTSNAFSGSLALSYSGVGEIPLGVRFNGTTQTVVAGDSNCNSFALPMTSVATAPSVVMFSRDGGNSEVYVAFSDTQQFSKLDIPSLASTMGYVQSSIALPSNPVTQPKGLFVDGVNFVGGGGVGSGSVWALASVQFDAGTLSYLATVNSGPPVLGSGYVAYGDNAGAIHRDSYSAGSLDGGLSLPGGIGPLGATPPVIGEGGIVYFATTNGAVTVRDESTFASLWSVPGVSGDEVAPAALDVYRAPDGGKDCSAPLGVLYVPVRISSQVRLRAILVDSKGLDPQAPWPKYQRDNANTGNASQSTSYWTCP